jgi:hypothetical protein
VTWGQYYYSSRLVRWSPYIQLLSVDRRNVRESSLYPCGLQTGRLSLAANYFLKLLVLLVHTLALIKLLCWSTNRWDEVHMFSSVTCMEWKPTNNCTGGFTETLVLVWWPVRPCSVNPVTYGLDGLEKNWEEIWLVWDLNPPNPTQSTWIES